MGLVQANNDYTVSIATQSNETTVSTTPTYDFPVFSGRPQPVQSIDRVNVTDSAAIVGDPFKHADEHWEAYIVLPGFANVLGTILAGLWATDTKTLTGPYLHTFSGLGSGSTKWIALYSQQSFSGSLKETYEAGQMQEVSFSFDQEGGPLKVG